VCCEEVITNGGTSVTESFGACEESHTWRDSVPGSPSVMRLRGWRAVLDACTILRCCSTNSMLTDAHDLHTTSGSTALTNLGRCGLPSRCLSDGVLECKFGLDEVA
jgi:hypothetical protein